MAKKKKAAESEEKDLTTDYQALGLNKLERHKHVRGCFLCSELLEGCSLATTFDYLVEAHTTIIKHLKSRAKPNLETCQYAGCIHHENVPKKLGLAILRVGHGGTWRDVHGVKVGTAPLVVSKKDHPRGFDMKAQDITHRWFTHLKTAAGDVYVRLGPKRTSVHLWVSPAYVSRREDIEDAPTIADIRLVARKQFPALKKWCLQKFADLRELAEMDLQFEEK